MKKYYFDFIQEKLKKDIIQTLIDQTIDPLIVEELVTSYLSENEIVFETLFGENDMAENFINYIFTEGFVPRDYSYFTEVYYTNGKASAYKFTTMNDHIIGTIYREFDEKDHLIKETWCKGKTSEILREFSSIFDDSAGGYKLIERDRNGVIVHQEIILSSND